MRDTLKSLLLRAKKYLILLIIVPVVTTALAYFLTNDKVKSPISNLTNAEVLIQLGNFQYPELTEASLVKTKLTNTVFLEGILAGNDTISVEELKQKLEVTPVASNLLQIKLRGTDEPGSSELLSAIVEKLLSMSDEKYQERINLITTTIDKLEKEQIGSEERVDGLKFLYNLQEALIVTKPTEVIEPVKVNNSSAITNTHISTIKKAIFGFLVGMMFNILFIFLPEVFRNNGIHK